MNGKAKYRFLLKDDNVRRWYENLARGSPITADVYLRRLGLFCKRNNLTPADLVKLGERKITELLFDYVSKLEKEGKTGSYIAGVVKVVKSWLNFNDIEIKKKIKIKGAQNTPTLKDERVPTQEELRKIFLAADERARVACVLVAHSGLRLEVLGNYKGDDGLRVGDFPEMKIVDGKVEFEKVPTIIRVRPELSKKGHEYITFLSAEGCEYLKEYLEMRIRKGEELTEDSAIITPKSAKKQFISTTNIGDIIRKPIRKAGFNWRPYVLRSYFDTQLMLAESKGLIIRDWRQFWMGHKGDIEHIYTLNKNKLPPNLIEEMREGYRKAQKYLQTYAVREKEDLRKEFRRQILVVAGFKEDEIKEEWLELDEEEFQKLVREKLKLQRNCQKVINVEEVEQYLKQGWSFVGVLPNNKVIVEYSARAIEWK